MSTATIISDNISPNTRIVRNTLFLTLKQIAVLVITIFSARVLLDRLGATDYGIYSTVIGISGLFTFFHVAIDNVTHRYIAYAVGKDDENELKRVFSSCLVAHFILAVLFVFLCETLGLWYLNTSVEIPSDRTAAAFWIFQFSIIGFAISAFRVPLEAEIIAHEKMGVFALISTFEVALQLLLVLLLNVIPYDNLILYGIFVLLVRIVTIALFAIYCLRKYPETRSVKKPDTKLILKVYGISILIMIGGSMGYVWGWGSNIWIASFYGAATLAALAIAKQIQNTATSFIANFHFAVTPQITKTYATDNLGRMHNLIVSCTKLSFYLFLITSIPLCLEANQILSLRLDEIPEQTVHFLQFFVLIMLLGLLQAPLHTANIATGKIVHILVFQLIKGVLPLMIWLILYRFLFILHFRNEITNLPECFIITYIIIESVSFIIQIFITRWSIGLSLRHYCNEVFVRTLLISIISVPLPILAYILLPDTITSAIIVTSISIVSVAFTAYKCGLNIKEKHILKNIFSFSHNSAMHPL